MATRVTVKLRSAGFKELLNSGAVGAELERRGAGVLAALPTDKGEEWNLSSFKGGDRHQVVVRTGNQEARRAAAEDSALTRALRGGR